MIDQDALADVARLLCKQFCGKNPEQSSEILGEVFVRSLDRITRTGRPKSEWQKIVGSVIRTVRKQMRSEQIVKDSEQ